MGRKILFITTDQQRYDSLGCNGGTVARTPVVDHLAAEGINYRRAYNQNTVCMPARSTMLTGQYVRTHGVVANGIPLPPDAPSVAQYLHDVAGAFHKFYHLHRVVMDDRPLMTARLALCQATTTVLKNGFAILGISAPEEM